MKRWQGSQRRIKRYERERLREEKVQSLIRKLKNFVNEFEEEEWIVDRADYEGSCIMDTARI